MKHAGPDSSPNGAFLRVTRVAIFGLFGLYDHDIPLHIQERVTILHGPNGVGKTVLLRLLAAAFGGRYLELAKAPFAKMEIALSNRAVITFERKKWHDAIGERVSLVLSWRNNGIIQQSDTIVDSPLKKRNNQLGLPGLSVLFPYADRLDADLATDHRVRQYISDAELYHFSGHGAATTEHRPEAIVEAEWFTKMRARVQVHLIETQRLLRRNPSDPALADRQGAVMAPTVRHYARDLHRRITEALAHYATKSQALDQSFPQRLLKARPPTPPGFDLKERMRELDGKRATLQKLGLLDAATSSLFDVASLDDLDHVRSNVMSLYVEDTQQKLAVLDDLARRITLLLDNVNRKFRHKSIKIHRTKGFVVVGHDKAPLKPDELSSGEQHELVLLYDLLFQVRPGTLVLIDEPELSLHVSWQKRFLSDLLEIVKTAEFDALIATHSPFIVGDHSDLMVALADDIDA